MRLNTHSCLCVFAKSNKFSFDEATYRCQIAPFRFFHNFFTHRSNYQRVYVGRSIHFQITRQG